jgi:branched-chain amino acid transport system ATP-binding protein
MTLPSSTTSLLLDVRALTKRFGGLTAVRGASLRVARGSITGLIGPNGAGKTTLFGMIAGALPPTSGQVMFDRADVTADPAHVRAAKGIGRTFQIVQPFAGLSVLENIAVGAHLRHRRRADALAAARSVADRVGLGPMVDQQAGSLTVAGRKRLELARALATEPKLLLLDEVLAGLNPSEIREMIPVVRGIRDGGVTILMVEHVMQAVISLCGYVYVIAEGANIAEGRPDEIARDPQVVDAYLGRGAAAKMLGPAERGAEP